jgi:dienelactone hydrolase
MLKRMLIGALVALGPAALAARAEVKTKEVTYSHGGVTFKGHLAWDDAIKGKRPGVLVVHEWWGLNDHARKRAEELAKLGYVAFACDMYGEGKVVDHPDDAGKMATEVRKNLETWQGRAKASLKVLQDHELVDGKKLAAIGFCFGGSTALQLAYTGADLSVVVTFHAAIPDTKPEQAKAVKARLLICHGAVDPFVPDTKLQAARAAWEEAKVDYAMLYLGGAAHSFTVPDIDKKGVKGLSYNAEADRRSWAAMQYFFREAFGPPAAAKQ